MKILNEAIVYKKRSNAPEKLLFRRNFTLLLPYPKDLKLEQETCQAYAEKLLFEHCKIEEENPFFVKGFITLNEILYLPYIYELCPPPL